MKTHFFILGVALIFTLFLAAGQFFLWSGSSPYEYIEMEGTDAVEAQDAVGEISDARVTEVDIQPEDVLVVEAKAECVLLEDFTGDSVLRWGTVNDGVMGGRSDGTAQVVDGVLTHTGTINTNGGGFSYVGARLPSDTLTGYSGIQIRLNTYGREYAINFNDKRYWRISHQVPVPVTGTDAWQEVFIDFDDTVPTVFSRPVDSEPFLGSAIDEMNFILSDGIDGPFRGEIDWIKLCV